MEMIFIQIAASLLNMSDATAELRQNAPAQKIDVVNWKDFPYAPDVTFWAGWNKDGLILSFQVKEKHILSLYNTLYAPAYENSCVEFFFSPTSNNAYYNLEMSCTGSRLWHYKNEKGEKTVFNDEELAKIKIKTSLPEFTLIDDRDGGEWNLTVVIPTDALPEGFLCSGREFTANFYKCGDKTIDKHYLSWSPIETEKPSFHQPKFFGKVKLQ